MHYDSNYHCLRKYFQQTGKVDNMVKIMNNREA